MTTQLLVFLVAGIIATFLNSAVFATVGCVNVSIEVSYTPPDGFAREAPYYRAASALTLTCVVADDNGGLFYQWNSTCQGSCFVQGGTTQSVSTHALHSRDSGVHTCTVYDGLGCTGNASITVHVAALEVTGYNRPFIVGLTGELTCSTHLDIRELEWYLVGIEVPLEKSSNATLTLVVDVQSTALDGNQFTCKVTTVDGSIYEETVTIEVKELEHVVSIAAPTNPLLAGEALQLTCVVTSNIAPQVSWVVPSNNATDESDVYISQPVVDGNTTTLVLSIAALNTSHGGEYSCLSFVSDPVSSQTNTRDVIVKIPDPVVSLAREPTDAVKLSCVVLVDETVDTAVNISISWTGPSGTLAPGSRITISDTSVSNLEYYSQVSFSSLLSSDAGRYNCTVNVEPSLSLLYVESGTAVSLSTILQAVLIEVSYTAPDQYPDYHPPEYRAASAVSLRCVAYGISGSVSYLWSSTCSGCFASNSTYQTISTDFLRSHDAGVHTCTVTDSLGKTESGSTVMKIVGAGIYVSYSYWHTGLLQAQAVANNSMLWVKTGYTHPYYTDSGTRLELWCCSNSSESNIGSFVFPSGSTYFYDTGDYDIDRQSAGNASFAGCIYFEIDSYYHYSLPYSGIYTCQIPDASGNTVDVSFGLYRQGYSNPPSISGLYHEASTTNFALDCHTSSYPATTVTWTKDGVPINIDRETTTVHSIVTSASNAYYKTIFMSSEDPDDLVGTYTCTAGNQFGSQTSGPLEITGIKVVHTQQLIVGRSGTFSCSSDLDILQIEWFVDGSLVTVANSSSSALELLLEPISTDHQDSVCSCVVTSPYGTQERSFTLQNVTVPDNWASVEIVRENPINNTHYTLTCTVNGVEGMNLPAVFEWVAPNGSVIASSERITVGNEVTNGTTTTLTLTFDPVYNSDADLYTCRASVDVPWMSQQPPLISATVDMRVTTQAIIQLKMGPLNCLNWEIERAIRLGNSIAAAIEGAVRERCNCNYLSSLSIYDSEFSCLTTLTSNQMIYRARINGTSSLLTANEILSYIEDWRDSKGTFLYDRLRLQLIQKDACPLRISSFYELECDTFGRGGDAINYDDTSGLQPYEQ